MIAWFLTGNCGSLRLWLASNARLYRASNGNNLLVAFYNLVKNYHYAHGPTLEMQVDKFLLMFFKTFPQFKRGRMEDAEEVYLALLTKLVASSVDDNYTIMFASRIPNNPLHNLVHFWLG